MYKHTEPQQPLISTAGRGWQKTIMPPGRISQCTLPGCDHQPLAAAVSLTVHTLHLTNQEVQPSQSAQTGTYTPNTYLPSNLAPNLFHILDGQLSLSDSTQAPDSAVQSLGRGQRPCTLSRFTSTGSSHITLQNGTCRPCNIPGVASSKSLAEDPQTRGLQTTPPHSSHPTALLTGHSFKKTQEYLSGVCVEARTWSMDTFSCKITLFVTALESGPAATAQEVCSVLSITSAQLRSPPRASN